MSSILKINVREDDKIICCIWLTRNDHLVGEVICGTMGDYVVEYEIVSPGIMEEDLSYMSTGNHVSLLRIIAR